MRNLHIALALVLSIGAIAGVGCTSPDAAPPAKETSEQVADDGTSEQVTSPKEDESTDVDPSKDEAANPEDTANEPAEETTNGGDTMHVGADGIGFVDVPTTWIEFQDAEGGDDLQWCDGTPNTIVTLNVIDVSTALEPEQREGFTVEVAANNIVGHLIEEGMDESSVTGARVQLAGRDAVQVYGAYKSGMILVIWLLEDDAGNYRYVSAEGTPDTIMDAVTIVESSYQL